MKILNLVLKGKWYDMIESGEKKEEYREFKPYWEKRLLNYKAIQKYVRENYEAITIKRILFPWRTPIENADRAFPRGFTHVKFRHGYKSKRSMLWTVESITLGFDGKAEWGAPQDVQMFIIRLGERIK